MIPHEFERSSTKKVLNLPTELFQESNLRILSNISPKHNPLPTLTSNMFFLSRYLHIIYHFCRTLPLNNTQKKKPINRLNFSYTLDSIQIYLADLHQLIFFVPESSKLIDLNSLRHSYLHSLFTTFNKWQNSLKITS